eukprot:CAMPEP_0115008280 /NCGR_PEP_ID=MMETSP0216-20121206/21804_1 /TAXON_ID=223996 /ORGANISM="Protocruzia adherens, Strain Boccale" /LENGTH=364 /DNA_ID=CAMNT_0002375629 /DNA_START=340 /DNA_END=1434 /DNA_ORIENTATION=+
MNPSFSGKSNRELLRENTETTTTYRVRSIKSNHYTNRTNQSTSSVSTSQTAAVPSVKRLPPRRSGTTGSSSQTPTTIPQNGRRVTSSTSLQTENTAATIVPRSSSGSILNTNWRRMQSDQYLNSPVDEEEEEVKTYPTTTKILEDHTNTTNEEHKTHNITPSTLSHTKLKSTTPISSSSSEEMVGDYQEETIKLERRLGVQRSQCRAQITKKKQEISALQKRLEALRLKNVGLKRKNRQLKEAVRNGGGSGGGSSQQVPGNVIRVGQGVVSSGQGNRGGHRRESELEYVLQLSAVEKEREDMERVMSLSGGGGDSGDGPTCVSCNQPLTDISETKSFGCPHYFHDLCLLGWTDDVDNCPICKIA